MRVIKELIRIKPCLKDLDGLRMLHISDLHLRGENRELENFIGVLSKMRFDFLFVTGDIVDDAAAVKLACKYLKKLTPKYGAWFALGNHDEFITGYKHLLAFDAAKKNTKRNDVKSLVGSLKSIGVKALLNESEKITIGGSTVIITGIVAPFGIDRYKPRHPCFSAKRNRIELLFSKIRKRENEFSIVLTHLPDMVNEIKNMNADLYLAGHTHGGQIRLPLIGPVFAFTKFQRKHSRGLFRMRDGSCLNVSAGLGKDGAIPIRLLCPPEATLIELKCP